MKAEQLKKCAICNKGMAHANIPIFYRIEVETFGLDADAIREIHGLETMLGAAAPRAAQRATPAIHAVAWKTWIF